MKLKSYKDLIAWQKAIRLVLLVYKFTKALPKSEQYVLVSQMRRAAVSIPSNIAEGYARQHRQEYIQFLSVAYASCAELETQLIICQELGYIERNEIDEISKQLVELLKILGTMIKKLKNRS